MLIDERRWCLFTSAGDKNNIRRWLEGAATRPWDLVAAYYGQDHNEFSELSRHCVHAFRTKGSKFQNLKKLVLEQPQFFDRYSHVWVCDDDIIMSGAQINEAFELTERLGFWVSQPSTRAEGKNGDWITCFAGPQWDYRIVNYVEVGLPIFRRDKLLKFLAVYDGSLVGYGIDHWYANLFNANETGCFAVFDRIQVTNPPNQDKGDVNEVGKLQSAALRKADWNAVREKFGLIEHTHKIFAYCRLAPDRELLHLFNAWIDTEHAPRIGSHGLIVQRLIKTGLAVKALLKTARRSGLHDAVFLLSCGLSTRRQRQAVGHGFEEIE